MEQLNEKLERKLIRLGTNLIDAKRARILIEPTQNAPGYWFGGGNMVRNPKDGELLLSGRYRDAGDSRSGLSQGQRGRELAIFRSSDDGLNFTKVRSWNKSDLYCGSTSLSIEGSALRINKRRVEVLVSIERIRSYPRRLTNFQKPGTGIWSIDTFAATTIEKLAPHENIKRLLASDDPAYLHIKDPNLSPGFGRNEYLMLYCAHPYTWSSSTSGWARLSAQGCSNQNPDFFPRGSTWDVAACRITGRLPIPRTGAFARMPPISLYFYDAAECLRPLTDHTRAVSRPRGYSCEELGGLAYGWDRDFPKLTRLSRLEPLFVSAHGTGCNRYVSVLAEPSGHLFATWQQSNEAQAQPLMGNRLSPGRIASILK